MKKIIIAGFLLVGIAQMIQGFYLTSSGVNPVLISKDVANFVDGFKNGDAYNIPRATENDLKHVSEYLIYRYHLDKKTMDRLGFHDKDPEIAWNLYTKDKIIERDLIVLTGSAFLLFPNDKPVPPGILESWTRIIEEGKYDLGHMLGIFQSQNISDGVCRGIYDAYAAKKGLLSSEALISSSIGGRRSVDSALSDSSVLEDSVQPLYMTGEQLLQFQQNNTANRIELDEEKDEEKNTYQIQQSRSSTFARFKSYMHSFLEQRDHLEKWALGGFSLFVLFTLYKISHRG